MTKQQLIAAVTHIREAVRAEYPADIRLAEIDEIAAGVLNGEARMTTDVLDVLRDLYGIAQDLHSRLSNLTSVAETERFMPPITAAAELLERAAAEPKAPQWDINSIERIARQQGVFGGRDGNTVKITGPVSISGPAMTRCGSCGQDYDMNSGHDCPEFHAK